MIGHSIKISEENYNAIKAEAKRNGISISAYLSLLISHRDYLFADSPHKHEQNEVKLKGNEVEARRSVLQPSEDDYESSPCL